MTSLPEEDKGRRAWERQEHLSNRLESGLRDRDRQDRDRLNHACLLKALEQAA